MTGPLVKVPMSRPADRPHWLLPCVPLVQRRPAADRAHGHALPANTRMSGQCPVCRAKQADTLLCKHCLGEIVAALDVVMPHGGPCTARRATFTAGAYGSTQSAPWDQERQSWQGLDAELTITLRRGDKGAPSLGIGHSSDKPLPFDDGASRAASQLRYVLAGWVIELGTEHASVWPADTLADMAGWLVQRRNELRYHADSPLAYRSIIGAVANALRVIDRGRDDVVQRTHAALASEVDAYCTSAEIRAILAERGIKVSGQRFANWVRRGRMTAATTDRQGHALYRVRDAETLAITCTHNPGTVSR